VGPASKPWRVGARLLLAAAAVQGLLLAAGLGSSTALCDTDKLFWGAVVTVFPLLSALWLLAWIAAAAAVAFVLAKLAPRYGWRRMLGGSVIVCGVVFGLSWVLSAAFGRHGCSMLI